MIRCPEKFKQFVLKKLLYKIIHKYWKKKKATKTPCVSSDTAFVIVFDLKKYINNLPHWIYRAIRINLFWQHRYNIQSVYSSMRLMLWPTHRMLLEDLSTVQWQILWVPFHLFWLVSWIQVSLSTLQGGEPKFSQVSCHEQNNCCLTYSCHSDIS